MKRLLILALLVLFPLSSSFGQDSLTTTFVSNNGLDGPDTGIFFDIENVGASSIEIVSWEINCGSSTGPGPSITDISVYTREGTSQGFEGTPDGWTLVATQPGVFCAGQDLPTSLNVGGFTIDNGQTTGVAMVIADAGSLWRYTNGTIDNQVYNNGFLEIRTNASYKPALVPGGELFSPRVWNGTVFYLVAPAVVPTLSEWGLISMAGILALIGIMVIRSRKAQLKAN